MAFSTTSGVLLGAGALYLGFSYILPRVRGSDQEASDNDKNDHSILKNNTSTRSYTTPYSIYPSILTFYHPHAHAEKLQAIADLPLLVFIHGIGGSLPQFAPLLGSLVNIAPCFGIELPGHGSSEFAPTDYNAYKVEAFAALWRTCIEDICTRHGHQKVVLIAHSMGCSISTLLATAKDFPYPVVGLVDLCPKATPLSKSETISARRFLSLPDTILDLLRMLDRRGGINSKSVKRMAGEAAGVDLRRLQLNFNRRYRTPVWKRTTIGCLPVYDSDGKATGGLPGQETWSRIKSPMLVIAGEADTVTKPTEVNKIVAFLQRANDSSDKPSSSESEPFIPVAAPSTSETPNKSSPTLNNTSATPSDGSHPPSNQTSNDPLADDRQFGTLPSTREISSMNSTVIKTVILPAPAAHALMYDHSTYRTVAGLIEDFLSRYVSAQLSLGWQLQQLTTSGKWDVKNLEKWKRVTPVSGPIGPNGMFRALKTLREQDEDHTPSVFISQWADRIFAVVDISHDSPVYDTKALERGGIQYHKFPTVSKVPPTPVEVADFIALIDRLRAEPGHDDKAIGVHCHYGYNRTGFFIACYLIERLNYRPQDAVDEFAAAKPPGIRHEHFLDTLFMRYHVGLQKAPTFRPG
ncbi:hypothetical protein PV10_00748 [Exophiala mesophila]|uniref:Tyrosine specific protein phosphatases domain-containing protein n=1 Tax=Exophiala mesophila TaxID=212818 RepID=A0A0D1X559_EXOME|nr:uncharacterized protein PV10_00748 [Exophiala mesophila]KIV96935.1 hypothetical protein PV10_00748 [Exophiala mesophila]